MRFPLAVFCSAFFLTMLAAALLLGGVFYAAVGTGIAVFAVLCLLKNGGVLRRQTFFLQCGLAILAVLCAMCLRLAHSRFFVQTVASLGGKTATVQARVTETKPGFAEDTTVAGLQVLNLQDVAQDGVLLEAPKLGKFYIEVSGAPNLKVGQIISAPVKFYSFASTQAKNRALAKNQQVGASLNGAVQVQGLNHSFLTAVRAVQYAASANIQSRLPKRLGSVAAAMAVGDKRSLPKDVSQNYRRAGLSHLLVVSGLHLSLFIGAAHGFFARAMPRRKAAAVSLVLLAFFAVFCGLSASVVRSGLMWAFLLLGQLLRRKAHPPTSLALALFIMAAQNPYAAADIGLLLSATATVGMLLSGRAVLWLKTRFYSQKFKTAKNLLYAAVPSVFASVFTLPVLVYAQMGISLLGIFANLVAIPLMPYIVLCSFVMALPQGFWLFNWLATGAGLVAGIMLRALEIVCGFCAALPWAYVPLGGGFALGVILAVYLLLFVGYRAKKLKIYAALAAGVLLFALAISSAFSANTVQVIVAGGANPSLVIIKNRQAVVLYRGRQSAQDVANVLWQNRVQNTALLVDLRQTTQSTEYLGLLNPQKVVVAKEDLFAGAYYSPINGLTITVVKQAEGTIACVDVQGYKVGCYTGAVDLNPYLKLDVLLLGSGEAKGRVKTLLALQNLGDLPKNAPEATDVLSVEDGLRVFIRPEKSVVFR